MPNLDCFDPRTSDPGKARRRAVTEQQERDILMRCRAGLDKRKIDLSMYATPALADDVADLASAMSLGKINIYGVSYGTRWGLEVMRRHPGLRGSVEGTIEAAEQKPVELTLQLEDGPQLVKLDGPKLLMVLLHMMREGEAALIPEAVAAVQRGDIRLLKMFAEDLESNDGGLLEQNAQQFDGLYNSIECRETWATVDRAARRKMIETSGVYGFNARTSKSPAFCPVWRVPAAPAAERLPVKVAVPTLLLSGTFDWLTPPAWGREAARHLPASRHVVFRAQGHGVVIQDPCAARLRDAFIEEPDPKRAPPCRGDTPLNFTAAYERARTLP